MSDPIHPSQIRISAWAIKNPVPVAVLFIALVVAGLISYGSLSVKQYPNISFPVVAVNITENGAAPDQMETQVSRPVEDALAGISNVRNIYTTVTQGVSTTTIEFEIGSDLQAKTDEVRTRIDAVRAQLPRDIDEPTVNRVEIEDRPILTYAVAAPGMNDQDLSWFVDDTVTRTLQAQKGVAGVSRVGGVTREINVIIDPEKMAARGLTAPQVNNALRTISLDAPGGRLAVGGQEQTLRVLGSMKTVEALRELSIPTGTNRYVNLTDIAQVGDGASENRGFARMNGRPVVGFNVSKTKDSSDVAVEDAVKLALDKLAKTHPGVKFTPVAEPGQGLAFSKIFSSVDETRSSFNATLHVLTEGMLLAALVVFLFLRDWRATAIAAVAMPVSLIPTFLVMNFMGFSLNVVTLLALTLVIGILVDDAIVEIENIEKRVASGVRPFQAAMEGADAIGLAVVATTMAIVVVFTPVSFMKGMAGQFFREFGLTVSVAVLFSLLTARFLTPLMAAYLMKPTVRAHKRRPFQGLYPRVLQWALDHRIVAAILGGLAFFASLGLAPFLPTGFQPAGDPDYLYVNVQGPPGATAADMEAVSQRLTRIFQNDPAVTGVFVQMGSNGASGFGAAGMSAGSDLRKGTATILLRSEGRPSGDAIRAKYRAALRDIPDARVDFLDFQGQAGVQQILASDSPEALDRAALELQREMRTLRVLSNPRPSVPTAGPEVIIRPKPAEAARLGVSADTIASVARVATVGDIDANVPKLDEGERRIPIRVRLPENARADLARIGGLRVPTAGGGTTRLDAVADISFQAGAAQISRLNRKRQITIEAELNGATLGQATQAIQKLPIMKRLPPGVGPADVGQQEAMRELFSSFGLAIFAGVSMIFAVLVLLFRSFFKPAVILSALPLAVGGAFIGLLAFRLSLSVPSLIGFLMLLGLAAKNSILLVEYAIEGERAGLSQREALLEACRERARPIVMTTMAMAAGMLPTALALEKGSEFRQPMAVAVIGGLLTSTLLSLVLVPVVYEFVDDFEQWLRPKLARLITPPTAPPIPAPEDRL
jgi:HAE1 family hydrophobic/amphiphilic exporter-1